MEFTFEATLWKWQGDTGWHFVSLPEAVTDEIEDSPVTRGGFGSVRVVVRVGTSTWTTSVFPDKGQGTFILPVKKQVRARERLDEGDVMTVYLSTLD